MGIKKLYEGAREWLAVLPHDHSKLPDARSIYLAGRRDMRDDCIAKLAEFKADQCAQIVAGINLDPDGKE